MILLKLHTTGFGTKDLWGFLILDCRSLTYYRHFVDNSYGVDIVCDLRCGKILWMISKLGYFVFYLWLD